MCLSLAEIISLQLQVLSACGGIYNLLFMDCSQKNSRFLFRFPPISGLPREYIFNFFFFYQSKLCITVNHVKKKNSFYFQSFKVI